MGAALHHPDLREVVGQQGPFLTISYPMTSAVHDAAHRLDVRLRSAIGEVSSDWPESDLVAFEHDLDRIEHPQGAAAVAVRPIGGPTLIEVLEEPVRRTTVDQEPLPRLAIIIESRQRAVPHMVIEADRAGADITAFDGGTVLSTRTVDGDRLHIHRGHPGGWSQRRFQQRAENTWNENAESVASAAADIAERLRIELIMVAGEVRAQSLVVDALLERHLPVTALESGSPEAIADETVRLVADHVARHLTTLAERLREELSTGRAVTNADQVLDMLAQARVDTLLVHDDDVDEPMRTNSARPDAPSGTRVVDLAIAEALRSDADIVVVPRLATMDGPLAALLRW